MDYTIAAISTAPGPAGIGIVRLSGERAIEIADRAFKGNKDLKDKKNHRHLLYGHIVKDGAALDEVLIAPFFGPNTYTREDMVEINCHGGMMAVNLVLEYMLELGCKLAEPGEFTRRAFLNGRLDLSQAEAVLDLIDAHSREGYKVGLDQLEGSLSREIETHRQSIIDLLALIVANIDFPTDEVDEVEQAYLHKKMDTLLRDLIKLSETSSRGKLLREGIKTVIVGKPNVGKSSLLNAFLRENRAIVTDIPGTTRDIIEEYVNLDGITLRIKDTAGIRETSDAVEKIGVDLARESLEEADLILAMFDSSKELEEEDREILNLLVDKPVIFILNKSDLPSKLTAEDLPIGEDRDVIETSLLNKEDILKIENRIKERFALGEIQAGEGGFITNLRHRRSLDRAIEAMSSGVEALEMGLTLDLIEVDLNDALTALGEITGETIEEEILDRIFSQFCIGK